ncbi:MAG: hypothetical protein APR62_02985 [Smithella sp. SDB]|nr:MAG: hypothetical protein APR62_02985 [Smithella sp. SDB]
MKQTIFALCVFFTMITAANSAEIYNCVGKDGKIFFTDNPPQGAKCKNSEGEDVDTSQQQQTDDETQQTGNSDESENQTGQAKKLIKMPRLGY